MENIACFRKIYGDDIILFTFIYSPVFPQGDYQFLLAVQRQQDKFNRQISPLQKKKRLKDASETYESPLLYNTEA